VIDPRGLGRAAQQARYTQLVDELAAVDAAHHLNAGDFFDAMVGTGAHRPLESLDDESSRLDTRERTIIAEMRSLAVALAALGEHVDVPSGRQRPPGAYFAFHRTWSPLPPPAGGGQVT
jgi:hypothetical protein